MSSKLVGKLYKKRKGQVTGDNPALCMAVFGSLWLSVSHKQVSVNCAVPYNGGQRNCQQKPLPLGTTYFGCIHNLSGVGQLLNCHRWWLGPIVKCQYFHSHPTPLSYSSPWHLSLGWGGQSILSYTIGKDKRDCLFPSKTVHVAGQCTLNNALSDGARTEFQNHTSGRVLPSGLVL